MQEKACLLIHQCVPRLHLKLLHVMSATATLDQTDSRSSAFGRLAVGTPTCIHYRLWKACGGFVWISHTC